MTVQFLINASSLPNNIDAEKFDCLGSPTHYGLYWQLMKTVASLGRKLPKHLDAKEVAKNRWKTILHSARLKSSIPTSCFTALMNLDIFFCNSSFVCPRPSKFLLGHILRISQHEILLIINWYLQTYFTLQKAKLANIYKDVNFTFRVAKLNFVSIFILYGSQVPRHLLK